MKCSGNRVCFINASLWRLDGTSKCWWSNKFLFVNIIFPYVIRKLCASWPLDVALLRKWTTSIKNTTTKHPLSTVEWRIIPVTVFTACLWHISSVPFNWSQIFFPTVTGKKKKKKSIFKKIKKGGSIIQTPSCVHRVNTKISLIAYKKTWNED